MLKFDPTESTGFLVGRVSHALKLRVQEFLDAAEIPLSAEEISILTVLAHLKEPEQMKPLAEKLGRDATTVSRQIAGLEQAGLVQRSPCADDGRSTVVAVTKAGSKLVERTIPLTLALRKQAMQGISQADAKTLVNALALMLKNLKDEA
ncbi:Transcriptional regulator SlyA [Symmachiella macrocystis]|uniref:Transcriptional regulator SlyA n=1 Tax=Symmachiella macrocystis TaxID=2527985 RepID=A0A5C6BLX6_9PLAN|nr:MarR family transcriptional regulator [Symmachiella macrocystis]TWU12119.1 Transcriptional regulator SlyA [Symmachiella macrocystis]